MKTQKVFIFTICPSFLGISMLLVTLHRNGLRMKKLINKNRWTTAVVENHSLNLGASYSHIKQSTFLSIRKFIARSQHII